MISNDLINTARNHLSRKHSDSRASLLASAGVPTEKTKLASWLRDAVSANEDEQAAAGRAVFHACTVRRSNGVDSDLPTAGPYGCRVSFVPLSARVIDPQDDWGNEPDENGEVRWSIIWGNCGTGFMEPVFISAPADSDPADIIRNHRLTMLRRNDCFATRAEAIKAATEMLSARAGR